jgi:predicted alpha/beta-fold hydrolase
MYALAVMVSSYYLFKYKKKSQVLKLVHSDNRLSKLYHLINRRFFEEFTPTLFLVSGHAQTFLLELLSILIRLIKKIFRFYKFKYDREVFQLNDGCKIAVDHAKKRNRKIHKEKDKILLIFPGITSSSDDYYVKSLIEDFLEESECRVVNARGLGGMRLYSPKMISSECYKDVREYIIKVCNENKGKKIFGVGFSFGGFLLSRALGENPEMIPSNFYAACGLCYPTCMEATKDFAEIHFNGLYSKTTLQNVKKCFFDNIEVIFEKLETKEDRDSMTAKIESCQLMSHFDTVYTTWSLGFNHISEYYEYSRSEKYLSNIKVPFLSMFCEDDPIIPITSVPFKTLKSNPHMVTIVSPHGGHLAFFGGSVIPQRSLDQPIKSFMKVVEILRDTKAEEICIK